MAAGRASAAPEDDALREVFPEPELYPVMYTDSEDSEQSDNEISDEDEGLIGNEIPSDDDVK